MKNVPVPVYCRPLVEKDPNRKVRTVFCHMNRRNCAVGEPKLFYCSL